MVARHEGSARRPLTLAAFVAAVALLVLLWVPSGSYAMPYSSQDSCGMNVRFRVNDVSKCRYGWERDACGNTLCTKGPGALCGGKYGRYGVCGEGLFCDNCNRCKGCSTITYECFGDDHCISW